MTQKTKARILYISALALCILPPSLLSLHYFPLWITDRDASISLFSVFILCLCLLPFRRAIVAALRSPSAWQMWLILYLCLTLLDGISESLRPLSLFSCLCSIPAAVLFRLARRTARRAEHEEAHRAERSRTQEEEER